MPRKYVKKENAKKSEQKATENASDAEAEPEPEISIPTERRVRPLEVTYKGRKYMIPSFFQKPDTRGEYRRMINDTLVELYMCNYLINETYDEKTRNRTKVYNSFFYTSLRLRMEQAIKVQPRRSELGPIYNRIFTRRPDTTVLQKEIIVVPIHIEKPKHWYLAIIHNASGAIRRPIPVPVSRLDDDIHKMQEFVRYEETQECRIIIMDSLVTWNKYRAVLSAHHTKVIETLRLWLQMTAASIGEELMGGRVRSVVCETLPRQQNGVDCGLYMMAFAEYFTWYNTQWTEIPTDSLAYLRMEPATEKSLSTDIPRLRLDALLTAMNNNVFETPK